MREGAACSIPLRFVHRSAEVSGIRSPAPNRSLQDVRIKLGRAREDFQPAVLRCRPAHDLHAIVGRGATNDEDEEPRSPVPAALDALSQTVAIRGGRHSEIHADHFDPPLRGLSCTVMILPEL